MSFWPQFWLGLEGPVVGTALIGGATAFIARRYQNRRLDRQVRMDFISRLSDIMYNIHVELSFFERWKRHAQPAAEELNKRRDDVDKAFIGQRIKLGAFQTEVDAYYRRGASPGQEIHRLTDLTMLRYSLILDLPRSQVDEMVDHLGQPGHSGFTVKALEKMLSKPRGADTAIWAPIAKTEEKFTQALRDAIQAVLATRPITKTKAFRSTKMLTAHDQDAKSAEPGAQESGSRDRVADTEASEPCAG